MSNSSSSLFGNTSNDYINPNLEACRGKSDNFNLEFVENGIGIVNGSQTISKIDFADLSIPVDEWNQQKEIVESGEVVFLGGLTKGLIKRQQGFDWPNLTTTNENLNKFFMIIDLSISYYSSFKNISKDIDASASYTLNTGIDTALNLVFDNLGIGITTLYDSSALYFTGDQNGFQFEISNVVLTIIDTSMNASSPFSYLGGAQVYTLEESVDVEHSKYPNTAAQGFIIKINYPTYYNSIELCSADKWLYLNNISNYIDFYEPITLQFDTSALNTLVFAYDNSTFLGIKSTISVDISTADVSSGTIDGSVLTNYSIFDSSISNSTISISLLEICDVDDSSISNSTLENIIFTSSRVWDVSIYNSTFNNDTSISNSVINNSWSNVYVLLVNPSTGQRIYVMEDDTLALDTSAWRVHFNDSIIWDSSFNNATISDSSIYRTYIQDSSLIRCTLYNCKVEDSTSIDSRTIMIDASIGIDSSTLVDSSIYYKKTRKKLDVGLSGDSTTEIMSSNDYLSFVTDNSLWYKVGDLYAWTSAPDVLDSHQNLINGFYAYNPHTFPVQIEYMVIV